jgi:hypothetical protein
MEKVKYLHKIKNGMVKTNLKLAFNSNVHQYNTRAACELRNDLPRTNRIRNGFKYTATLLYNRISKDIRSLKNIKEFTRKIKDLIKNNMI